jgi:serine/threonine protein kinase/predicted Zn-dependent protease
MPTWNSQANDIFLAALEFVAPEERARYVERACHGQARLQEQVRSLLRANEQADSFLEAPAIALVQADLTAPLGQAFLPATVNGEQLTEQVGALIGPYKLLEQIGEGGMGLVYMAEQQRPVRRLVALKVIKPGMDSRQVVARFEAERQALAMMDHPNIARVLDAGTTETGRPYFVMELVRGYPITEYCDQQRLSVRQRLELLIQVCQAVQHAHQKGIIHRDLKPTNILVTMHDALAVPKVIDFGIAKALGTSLTEHTLHTGYAQLIGTPLYMSPEQAEMNAFGVDTRSDVYSLGVLLYELLTSTTPFDKETLGKAGLDEMRRIIREDEPLRPSARLSTLKAGALSTVSALRSADPRRISTALRGELDWIVMKALEKDRTRRYESSSALAQDIQSYLNQEPVAACPPSTRYRLTKYAQRHRVALFTSSLIAAALILGTGLSLWQAWEATASRNLANARLKSETAAKQDAESQRRLAIQQQQLTEEQRQLAEERLKRAEANYQRALATVDQMLKRVGGEQLYAIPKMLPVQRQLLEDAVAIYEEMIRETPEDPQARLQAARTYVSLMNVNGFLKDYSQRNNYAHRSIELLEQLPHEQLEQPEYGFCLAEAYWYQGIGLSGNQGQERMFRRAVELVSKVSREHPEYRDKVPWKYLMALGNELKQTHPSEAEENFRRAALSGESTGDLEAAGRSRAALAQFLSETDRFAEAEREFRQSLALLEQWLTSDRNKTWARNARADLFDVHLQFGNHLVRTKELARAESEFRLALEMMRALARDFPDVATYQDRENTAFDTLLGFLRSNNRTSDIEKLLAETAAQMSPSTPQAFVRRADIYDELKNHSGAINDYSQALQLDPNNGTVANKLVKLYTEKKQYEQAVSLLDKRMEADSGNANLFLTRAELDAKTEQYEKALADCEKAVELKVAPQRAVKFLCNASRELNAKGDLDNALRFAELALKLNPQDYQPYFALGELAWRRQQHEEAISHLNTAVSLFPRGWWLRRLRAESYFALGKYAESLADLTELVELHPGDPQNLFWIDTALVAACPDDNLRAGLLKLADRTIEQTQGSDEAYHARGVLNGQFGRLDQARADFERSVNSSNAGWSTRYRYALLSLRTGNHAAYRAACAAMLATFHDTTDPNEAHFTAWTCALAPSALEDYSQALELARRAVNQDPTDNLYLGGLAAVQLRSGQYEDTLATLAKTADNKSAEKTSPAYGLYLQAITEHHLKRPGDAGKSLAKANELADQELSRSDQPPAWNRKLTLELFRQEAADLLAATDSD